MQTALSSSQFSFQITFLRHDSFDRLPLLPVLLLLQIPLAQPRKKAKADLSQKNLRFYSLKQSADFVAYLAAYMAGESVDRLPYLPMLPLLQIHLRQERMHGLWTPGEEIVFTA